MSVFNSSTNHPLTFNFSSVDRVEGTPNTNFQSLPIDLGVHNYNSVCLVQASIPRSFYNVPNLYRTFNLIEDGVSTPISLPKGSYNKSNLLTVLKTYLNDNSPNGWVYNITYSSASQGDTFHYIFTISGNTSQPSFQFTDSMFRQLGFDKDTTYNFVGDSLESVNCIDLAYINRCYIKTDMIQSNDNTLDQILNYGSYQMLSFCYYHQNNFDLNTRDFNQNNKTSWVFSLVDEYNQIIDLNGIAWSFTVCFFERSDIHEVHKRELNITNEERLFKLNEERLKLENEEFEIKNKLNNKINERAKTE